MRKIFGKYPWEVPIEDEKTEKAEKENEEARKRGEQRQKDLKDYYENLNKKAENDLEYAVNAFVNHPDFPLIYNQTNTIENASYKWAFILRKAYEIGEESDINIGYIAQSNHIEFKKKLEGYGIYLLCPYFKSDENSLTKEICLIDGKNAMALCNGQYQSAHGLCKVFENATVKSAAGFSELPKIERLPLKKQIHKIEVEPVDLNDLDDWWKNEGKYG